MFRQGALLGPVLRPMADLSCVCVASAAKIESFRAGEPVIAVTSSAALALICSNIGTLRKNLTLTMLEVLSQIIINRNENIREGLEPLRTELSRIQNQLFQDRFWFGSKVEDLIACHVESMKNLLETIDDFLNAVRKGADFDPEHIKRAVDQESTKRLDIETVVKHL